MDSVFFENGTGTGLFASGKTIEADAYFWYGKTEIWDAAILAKLDAKTLSEDRPVYSLDFGNGLRYGEVILYTISDVKQPSIIRLCEIPSVKS